MSHNTTIDAQTGGDVINDYDLASGGAYSTTGKVPSSTIFVSATSSTVPTPVTATNGLYVQPGTSTTWAISVASLPLPSGAAIETGGNLASLNGKVTACNTGAVVITTCALPSGAATAAKQPALGVAGTASADVLTIQGIAGATAVKVDGSAVTQPISGSLTTVTTVTTCGTVTNLSQMGGAAIAMGTGVRSAGTQRVTIATDDVVPVSQSGNWSVRSQDGSGNALTSFSVGTQRALSIAVVDASGNQITGFGSGTQYAEDSVHASGDLGSVALAVRKDTATQLAGTDGDYSVLITDASGRLHVNVGNNVTAVGAGASGAAVSGNPVLVAGSDGTNARSITTDTSGNQIVVGSIAHGTTDSGNPLKIGGKALSAAPSSVTTGQRVDSWLSIFGRLGVFLTSGNLAANGNGIPGGLPSTASESAAPLGVGILAYNGASTDLVRNNLDGTILSSSARTVTTNSADITNHNGNKLLLIVNVSSIGTGSITPYVQVKDSISGNYFTLWTAAAALTANGTYAYSLALGSTGGSITEHVPCGLLARTWRCGLTSNNANSVTASVSSVTIAN